MRTTAVFFAYLFACLVLAALVTAPAMATGWIQDHPHRVMGNLAQAFILLGVWPFLRLQRLTDRTALGYGAPWPTLRRAAGLGWVAGLAMLLILVLAILGLEIRLPDAQLEFWPYLAKKAFEALLGGILIGVLEETFFRGALYTAVRRYEGIVSAVFWTALLYMLVHFMKPAALPPGVPLDWGASWQIFASAFTRVLDPEHVDSMAALFAAGVLLALIRERSGHIGWCIGLHAGWIFVIQVTRRATDPNPEAPLAALVGGYDGVIGWLAMAWIGLAALLYWWWTGRSSSDPA